MNDAATSTTVAATVEMNEKANLATGQKKLGRRPFGLEWRAGYWFTTVVIGLGIAVDLLVYSIIIPVIPFHLEELGYNGVSGLTGWLLFAYSVGLLIASLPIAHMSERYNDRQWSLIAGFVFLIASQVMFMEAPNFATMIIARFIQGLSSAVVFTVGLALCAEVCPPQFVGRQLGLAMMGFNFGLIIGPPLGGAIYTRFGFRGPFVFGIIGALIDLAGRLLIIERKNALKWGFDPHVVPESKKAVDATMPTDTPAEDIESKKADEKPAVVETQSAATSIVQAKTRPIHIVVWKILKQPRAVAVSYITFVYGVIYSAQEPTIPLHLADVWGLNSAQVGIVFVAAALPALFSTPITGWLTDKKGSEFITPIGLIFGLPWSVVIIIEKKLALFVVSFAFMSFSLAGVVAPLTAELADIGRNIDGVGYAHLYAAYNLAYGAGSTIGPIIGGQIYDNVEDGWLVVSLFATGIMVTATLAALIYIGERPLLGRILKRNKKNANPTGVEPPIVSNT